MFFKNPTPEYKIDSPVDIDAFLKSGEYDQGDKAIIAYDDLYDFGQDKIKEGRQSEREEVVKMLEGMKVKGYLGNERPEPDNYSRFNEALCNIHNATIDDALSSLTKKK